MRQTFFIRIVCVVWIVVLAGPAWAQVGVTNSNETQPKILGGRNTDITNWPWAVALVNARVENAFRGLFCGGTLISERWVVTAAHCVTDGAGNLKYAPGEVHVVLGRTDLRQGGGDRIPVKAVVLHPRYNPNTNDSDLALLQLARIPADGVLWGVLPLIPPGDFEDLTQAGNPAWILGWGRRGGTAPSSPILQEAQLPLISQTRLILAYPPPFFEITDNMIGAGREDGSVDTCAGDSGGPLMVRREDGYVLAGVTSWGLQCGTPGAFGVYVRMANNCGWINGVSGVGDCGGGSGGGCTVSSGAGSGGNDWMLPTLIVLLLVLAGRRMLGGR